MATTARLGLTLLEENQAGAAVTANSAFSAIDAGAALLAVANTYTQTNTFTGRTDFTLVAPATTQRGVVNIGSGGFAGSAGHFAGSASGTQLALNAPSGFGGDLANFQVNGSQFFRVGAGGAVEAVSFRQSGGSRGFNGGWAWFIATTTPATDADHTVGASEYIAPILQLVTGAWTTGRNVILPNTLGGTWIVVNNTAFSATFKTAAGSGIAVAAGRSATLRGNGTNILRVTADCDFSV